MLYNIDNSITESTDKTPKFPKVEWQCWPAQRRRQSPGAEVEHTPCCHVNC